MNKQLLAIIQPVVERRYGVPGLSVVIQEVTESRDRHVVIAKVEVAKVYTKYIGCSLTPSIDTRGTELREIEYLRLKGE